MASDVKLIEHLPCYSCHLTSEHKIGRDHESLELQLGAFTIPVIAIHDGKGGLKSFNFSERGFSLSLDNCYFPGFIPSERVSNDEYDLGVKQVDQVCNVCNAGWKGWLYLEENKKDGVAMIRKMDIWPYYGRRPALDGAPRTEETALYSIEHFAHKLTRITAKPQECIFEYRRQTGKYRLEGQSARSLLESIDSQQVPKTAIVSSLEELAAKEQTKTYEDVLAKTVAAFEAQKAVMALNESALEAALVILYRADEQKALELARVSGIAKDDFLNSVSMHAWFFMDEQELANDHPLNRLAGIMNGPNYFLTRLKESEQKN